MNIINAIMFVAIIAAQTIEPMYCMCGAVLVFVSLAFFLAWCLCRAAGRSERDIDE